MFAQNNDHNDDHNDNHNNNNNNNNRNNLPLGAQIWDLDAEQSDEEEEMANRMSGVSMEDRIPEVPKAPVKIANFVIRLRQEGLPKPFAPRPAARKILFVPPKSPVGDVPALPKRKAFRRTRSHLGDDCENVVARKRLNFELEEEGDEASPQPSASTSDAACDGACALVDTPASSLLNAPKKRRSLPASHKFNAENQDPNVVAAEPEPEQPIEEGEEDMEEAGPSCPATPRNTPRTPRDGDFDMDIEDDDRHLISTPASAPLPIMVDSPIAPIRRRRSDGPCFSKKRLRF